MFTHFHCITLRRWGSNEVLSEQREKLSLELILNCRVRGWSQFKTTKGRTIGVKKSPKDKGYEGKVLNKENRRERSTEKRRKQRVSWRRCGRGEEWDGNLETE